MALAVRDRAGDEGHSAQWVKTDFRGLDGRVGGLLDGVGDADAAKLAALARLLAPRLEAPPVGELHGAVHVLLEAPAVIGEGERRLVGHLLRRNGIAAAQLRGIDFHFVGRDVDQPLDHEGRLGPPGAAIGRGAVRVGEHARDRHVQRRRGVDAAHRADVDDRRHRAAERHEGAEIAEAPDPHGEELSVLVEGECRVDDVVARVVVADMRFVAGGEPFHRLAGALRRPQHQDDLGIDRAAQAVGAADVAGDQPELAFRNLERALGDGVAEQPWPLEAALQGVAPGAGVVFAGDAARLERVGGDTVDDEALLDHMRGARERFVDRGLVAGLVEIGLVVGTIGIELRRAGLEGILGIHDGRAGRIVDLDPLGGVARLIERVGDHDRDRIADMHRAADGDRGAVWQVHRAAVALLVRRHRRHGAEPVRLVVLAGQDDMHAGHLQCRAGVDAADVGMGVRRAHDGGVKLVGELEVVVEAPAPREKTRIFAPPHRLTDRELTHG